MVYVIIGVALLFIIVPIISVLPSARQKSQMRMRAAARNAGVSVELTSIEDPNPKQDKYISPTGRALAPQLKTVAWRVQRKRGRDWRQLPQVHWCCVRRTSGWDWTLLPTEVMEPDFVSWLKQAVERLPADVEQVEEESFNLTVHWHERTEGSESLVFDFLKECTDRKLHLTTKDV